MALRSYLVGVAIMVVVIQLCAAARHSRNGHVPLRHKNHHHDPNLNISVLWKEWLAEHPVVAELPKKELQRRYKIFAQNIKVIRALNRQRRSIRDAEYGVTDLAHLTSAEFLEGYTNRKIISVAKRQHRTAKTASKRSIEVKLPRSLDWRKKGAVTPVKDQGGCGSCWAHATVASIEGTRAVAGLGLNEYAPQQLVDCAYNYHHRLEGCAGGEADIAFQYIKTHGGVATLASYPTTPIGPWFAPIFNQPRHPCKFTGGPGTIKGYTAAGHNDKSIMQTLAHYGPSTAYIVVGVDKHSKKPKLTRMWQHYKGGVIKATQCDDNSNDYNHVVALVGYGTMHGIPVWILKNQWTTSWGDQGYLYLQRGKNTCAVRAGVFAAVV